MLKQENALLKQENALLKLENAELRSRLGSNSKNSHQPPSKDLFKSKPAFPKSSTGKVGGQKGHKGNTLSQSLSPDEVIHLGLPSTCSCGCTLSGVPVVKEVKRQVFGLPEPKLQVKEYVQSEAKCPNCGKGVKVEFPKGVNNHVQYDNSVLAFCSLLSNGCHLSCAQISQLFFDLFGQPLNPATVVAANERCYEALAPSEAAIKAELLRSEVVHFDESGLAVGGKTHWLHVSSTDRFTYLFAHEKRGREAIQSEQSLLPEFHHFAVHDCWASYFQLEHIQHAVCNAHILRELEALIEKESKWAAKMKELLLELYQLSPKGTAIAPNLAPYLVRYKQICQDADKEEPPPIKAAKQGKPKSSKGRNLLNRLRQLQECVLAFAKYEQVPFTNNQAERDIRPAKSKIKIAGCFRKKEGADYFARIQAFISTARK